MSCKLKIEGLVILLLLCASSVHAEMESRATSTFVLVDMMNAFLILICCIFLFAIVGTLRNEKFLDLVRSAHFFKIKKVISAWTLLASAVLLYALTEILFAFDIIDNPIAYKLLKTLFGVLFAAGLFVQYMVLLKYIKQIYEKTVVKNEKKKS